MFIELTDILRCPEPHDEQFLVLIPDDMAGRSVRSGRLGCPVCHREYLIRNGVAEFAGSSAARESSDPDLEPEALAAFLGLTGPGGYIGVVGGSAVLGNRLTQSIPAVHFVGINPSPGSTEGPMLSLMQASSIPIKSRSLRGIVLLPPYAGDPAWQREAGRVVLPGLRVVGQGAPPSDPGLEILAMAGGWWVAQKD
jgi:uncharacterized protein YbaR (Trm112 family)